MEEGKKELKEGYAFCSNEWSLDKDIKNELGLLLIISSLCASSGYCWASNKYLSELFEIDEVSMSRKLKKLESKNYISIEYEKRGCEVISRKIRLTKMLTDDLQKNQSTINKNVKENNISLKNIKKDISEDISKESRKNNPPTLEEIEQYVNEKGLEVNAKQFFDYFEVGNWIDSKGNKVRNWKQKILTWNSHRNKIKTKEEMQKEDMERWLNE